MRLMATTTATAILLSMGAAPVWAHHSFSMFDRNRTETLSGTVKDLEIINPHSWLSLVVVDASGRASEWSMEAGGPPQMQRAGLGRDVLHPGDKVTVAIHPLRDGSHGGQLVSVTLAGGRTLQTDLRDTRP